MSILKDHSLYVALVALTSTTGINLIKRPLARFGFVYRAEWAVRG